MFTTKAEKEAMTPMEREAAYVAANNNERAALDYQVANGTINAEDALTEIDDLKAKKAEPATTGGAPKK